MDQVDEATIRTFLSTLAERVPEPSQMVLLGGSALIMLGMPRTTINIDYLGDDLAPGRLDKLIEQVATELDIYVDPVAITRFVPVPEDASSRHVFLDKFGQIEAWAFDPYTIALSKLDRGFESDIDDIAFLVRQGRVDLTPLQDLLESALVGSGTHTAEGLGVVGVDGVPAQRLLQVLGEGLLDEAVLAVDVSDHGVAELWLGFLDRIWSIRPGLGQLKMLVEQGSTPSRRWPLDRIGRQGGGIPWALLQMLSLGITNPP